MKEDPICGLNFIPPKGYVEVPTPSTSEYDIIWKVFADVIKIK